MVACSRGVSKWVLYSSLEGSNSTSIVSASLCSCWLLVPSPQCEFVLVLLLVLVPVLVLVLGVTVLAVGIVDRDTDNDIRSSAICSNSFLCHSIQYMGLY